jgi:hypothetical protein
MVNVTTIAIYRVSADAEELDPTDCLSDLGGLVARLDEKNYDQLYLELGPDIRTATQICLNGGAGGVVVMFIIRPDDDTYYLYRGDDAHSLAVSRLTSGGGVIEVLDRWKVSIDKAARALYYYLLTEELDPALAWEPLSSVDFAAALRAQRSE